MIRATFIMTIAAALLGRTPVLPAGAADQAAAGAESRKGYILFRSEFPDPEAIRPYGRAVVGVAAKFGGRFIALADHPEPVEGNPDTRRVVILEFPTLAAARAFWNSDEYAEIRPLREGVGVVEAVMFEGA